MESSTQLPPPASPDAGQNEDENDSPTSQNAILHSRPTALHMTDHVITLTDPSHSSIMRNRLQWLKQNRDTAVMEDGTPCFSWINAAEFIRFGPVDAFPGAGILGVWPDWQIPPSFNRLRPGWRGLKRRCRGAWCALLNRQMHPVHGLLLTDSASSPTGELELRLEAQHDWTDDWQWAFSLRAYGTLWKGSTWVLYLVVLFDNFPEQWQEGINWKKARTFPKLDRTRYRRDHIPGRGWDWVACTALSSSCRPGWRADVVVRHLDNRDLKLPDVESYLSAERIVSAGLDERTGRGTFKRRMEYEAKYSYRNTLTGQRPEAWNEGLLGRFAEFARPILT